MGAYLTRRFLLMALTLFGMSVLIFVMLRLVPAVRGRDVRDVVPDHFRGGVAKHLFRTGVPRQERPVERTAEDGVARVLDDCGELGAGLLRLLERRNVLQNDGGADNVSGAVPDGGMAGQDIDHPPVLGHAIGLARYHLAAKHLLVVFCQVG